MTNEERMVQINEFLEAFDKMLDKADAIEDFVFDFSVTITSNNEIAEDRVSTINGVNQLFTKHGKRWSSFND